MNICILLHDFFFLFDKFWKDSFCDKIGSLSVSRKKANAATNKSLVALIYRHY